MHAFAIHISVSRVTVRFKWFTISRFWSDGYQLLRYNNLRYLVYDVLSYTVTDMICYNLLVR